MQCNDPCMEDRAHVRRRIYTRAIDFDVRTHVPLKAMPEHATTQVWTTVFSWRVNGLTPGTPALSSSLVHEVRRKKPRSPAETLREGMIPVVRLSFMTMTLNMKNSSALT